YCSQIWEDEKEKSAMAQKIFRAPIELKAEGEEGAFKSVFAKFNVVDLDGDVTEPGAFRDGQEVVVEGWNHDYGLPPGKGVIHSNDEEAWIDGRFFLDTTAGKDHYLTLKALEGLEEWSYTFDIEEAGRETRDGVEVRLLQSLDVWGVAPVTRGAGIGTRTVTLKGAAGLTDDEVERLKTLLKEQQGAKDGASVEEGDEGEVDAGEAGDGKPGDKPSGTPPSLMQVAIDIAETELDLEG
ncbi:MAG: HK97 family phage prohead protease, partial [Anaerolineae bacterium]